MERNTLPEKQEYTGDEVLEIVRETLFQISQDLDQDLYKLKDRISTENDSLLKAGMNRKKHRLNDDRNLVDRYFVQTGHKRLTECCDAPIQYYALNTRGQCSNCIQDMPDTYEEDIKLEEFLEFINDKIEEENNAE